MPRTKSPGTCLLCRDEFDKSTIARHLAKCAAESERDRVGNKKYKKRTVYLLKVQGKYDPVYWLCLEMQSKAHLADLDDFLRDIWLECCGHMSAFRLKGKKKAKATPSPLDLLASGQFDPYAMDEFIRDPNEIDMDEPIASVWSPKDEMEYDYDFGSTTTLTIKMISERAALVKPNEYIRLVARNHKPIIPCGECGSPSTIVDTELSYDAAGWLCEKCYKKQTGQGEEIYGLPVVNSPRVGVCGYTGSSKTDLGEPLPTVALTVEE